ncbi:50S ribosomal protein L15 [Candidatus Kapabacteria bacterium]|nr:50S ribosomal protein L15 [Candidatus Kapabacteria bacterium]
MKHIGNLTYQEGSKQSKKRIGRGQGSGHGGTSTKGHKGQKSRSGASISIGFEGGQMPLHRRVPKYGFTNHKFKTTYSVINLDKLQKFIDEGQIESSNVGYTTLKKSGIIKGRNPLKVLGNGEIKTAITITDAKVTASAKDKIVTAGGSVKIDG